MGAVSGCDLLQQSLKRAAHEARSEPHSADTPMWLGGQRSTPDRVRSGCALGHHEGPQAASRTGHSANRSSSLDSSHARSSLELVGARCSSITRQHRGIERGTMGEQAGKLRGGIEERSRKRQDEVGRWWARARGAWLGSSRPQLAVVATWTEGMTRQYLNPSGGAKS